MENNYLVLSRKWRPQSFDDVIGQIHVTQTLRNALEQNRLAHGYLFTGSRGVGKTSVARILSRSVNCSSLQQFNPCNDCNTCNDILAGNNFDVIELDGASNRGIDEIRDLRESVKYAPSQGNYKVYIIDEVHMLTKEAFNALLKTLEEPPPHVLFILATTDPHKIPQTILSRTQRFNFRRISESDINNYLITILGNENKEFEEESIQLISRKADGSMRDALSLLDQVIAYSNGSINTKVVSDAIGLIDNQIYIEILVSIAQSNLSSVLSNINDLVESGNSINDFVDGFIDFLNRCMHSMISGSNRTEVLLNEDVKRKIDKINLKVDFIIDTLELTLQFQNQLKFLNQPMIALETHFIKLVYMNGEVEIDSQIDFKDDPPEAVEQEEKQEEKQEVSPKEVVANNAINITQKQQNIDITIDYVKSKWNNIMNAFSKEHQKIASFLSDVSIAQFKEKKLILEITNGSNFHIESLNKDSSIIDEIFSEKLGCVINVDFKLKEIDEKKDNSDSDKPKQHPLLSKAIDLLDGEVI